MLQPLPDHAAAPQKGTEEMARATPAALYQGKVPLTSLKQRLAGQSPLRKGADRQTGF